MIQAALLPVLRAHKDKIELVIVHDEAVYASLPDDLTKSFSPTLSQPDYMALLATCDVSLLPLADTPFNRLKSDLKLIESCAAGVVPIFSPVVYAADPANLACGVVAEGPADWGPALASLLENPGLLAGLRQAGRDHVAGHRMHAHQITARRDWYVAQIGNWQELEVQRKARLKAMGREHL